jgi:hypothetical protein
MQSDKKRRLSSSPERPIPAGQMDCFMDARLLSTPQKRPRVTRPFYDTSSSIPPAGPLDTHQHTSRFGNLVGTGEGSCMDIDMDNCQHSLSTEAVSEEDKLYIPTKHGLKIVSSRLKLPPPAEERVWSLLKCACDACGKTVLRNMNVCGTVYLMSHCLNL